MDWTELSRSLNTTRIEEQTVVTLTVVSDVFCSYHFVFCLFIVYVSYVAVIGITAVVTAGQ
jgi:hypothetical protein